MSTIKCKTPLILYKREKKIHGQLKRMYLEIRSHEIRQVQRMTKGLTPVFRSKRHNGYNSNSPESK
jgi:hypothetical protein